MPQTEPGEPRKFEFSYNSDITETTTVGGSQSGCNGPVDNSPREVSRGWGEMSHMVTPSGSTVNYSFTLDGEHSLSPFGVTDYLTYQSLTKKELNHDGILTPDTWTYEISDSVGRVTNPDGGVITEQRHCSLPGTSCATDKAGLAYRSSRPFMMTERHWTNLQFSDASIQSPGGVLALNPVVDVEYTTLLNANNNPLKMSTKAYLYDY